MRIAWRGDAGGEVDGGGAGAGAGGAPKLKVGFGAAKLRATGAEANRLLVGALYAERNGFVLDAVDVAPNADEALEEGAADAPNKPPDGGGDGALPEAVLVEEQKNPVA
jgi:hypothetical protein